MFSISECLAQNSYLIVRCEILKQYVNKLGLSMDLSGRFGLNPILYTERHEKVHLEAVCNERMSRMAVNQINTYMSSAGTHVIEKGGKRAGK